MGLKKILITMAVLGLFVYSFMAFTIIAPVRNMVRIIKID